jgi:hypothetical protein
MATAANETMGRKGSMIRVRRTVISALPADLVVAGGQGVDEGPGQEQPEEHHRPQDHGQQRQQPRRQLARAGRPPFRQRARIGGDEGRGERALREEVAQQVRDPEGGLERVGVEAGAQERGEDLLPGQAEEPGEEGQGRDEAGGAHVTAARRRSVDRRVQHG